jgi:hypothetical protein
MKYKIVVLLAVVVIALAALAPAAATPANNPPPPIWCPGPDGSMTLCSPVPTPQRCVMDNGYVYGCYPTQTPTPAPTAEPQVKHSQGNTNKLNTDNLGLLYWFWLIFGK